MDLPLKPSWMDDALCAQTDTELFFPSKSDAATAVSAKRVCEHCPVLDLCLEYAVENCEVGVWGGTTDRQRVRIRRARKEKAA